MNEKPVPDADQLVSTIECLIVMRHGDASDLNEVDEVARALAQTFAELPRKWSIVPSHIEHANQTASEATADRLALALAVPQQAAPTDRQVGPPRFDSYGSHADGDVLRTRDALSAEVAATQGGISNAIVVVGHEPAIDMLLDEPWVDEPVALARGEAACLVRRRADRGPWHLWWVLTPSSQAQRSFAQMREKVASKMTVLSVLAGFTTATIATLLTGLPPSVPERQLTLVAAVLLSGALIVFVGSLWAYDRLMLPPHFWRSEPPLADRKPYGAGPVWRPPSAAAWVVYQSSVDIWKSVEKALVAFAIAGALVGAAAVWRARDGMELLAMAAVGFVGVVFAIEWWRRHRPALGWKD